MADQEINEAVARKMGWRKDGDIGWIQPKPHKDGFLIGHAILPDYCHSIAAAWEVVEFLRAKGLYIGLAESCMGRGWSCTIWFPMSDDPEATSHDPLVKIDTAPMAICLAFLKLP